MQEGLAGSRGRLYQVPSGWRTLAPGGSDLLGYCLLDLVGKGFLAAVLEDPNRRAEYLLPEAAPD